MSIDTPVRPTEVEVDPPELELFVEWCRETLTLEDGSPLELYAEQRRMLRDLFNGCRETLILIPKKNGKSTLLAALALFHLCTTPDAECVIAAASRDQASIMLRQAQGFIRRSPDLQQRLTVKQREIGHRTLGGRVRILASDVDTADGVIPTLALVDELHRHKSGELYGVFLDGLGPRNGQMATISTAGDDEDSPLGRLRKKAHGLPGMQHEGSYRYVKSEGFAMHEWALDKDADREDLQLVKQANPAPWQTIKALRQRKDSPSTTDWQWARFACGVWLSGEFTVISDKMWSACASLNCRIPTGAPGVWCGIDLGWKWDTTALVPIWQPLPGEKIRVHPPTILTPPQDGMALAEEDIWQAAEEFWLTWPEITFVLDPNAGGEALAQRLDMDLEGARVVTYSQMPTPMSLAAQRTFDVIKDQALEQPDDEELNSHVLAAGQRAVGEGFRFIKQRKRSLPIDGLIALSIAVSALVGDEPDDFAMSPW